MTQEEKDLLIKDLCARLFFGVKVLYNTQIFEVQYIEPMYEEIKLLDNENYTLSIDEVKPYLFPLENMTEEQRRYINDRWGVNEKFDFEIDPDWGKYFVELGDVLGFINWCYENHLDINGLIPKDLANDATGLNIY